MTTPLEQRQWRGTAQRAVRVALTASKEARSRFEAAAEAGLARVQAAVATLEAAAASMRGAAEELSVLPCPDAATLASQPIFSSLPLPRVAALLRGVAEMYCTEHESKVAIAARVAEAVEGRLAPLPPSQEALSALATTWQAAWLLDPHLQEERVSEVLEALTLDMAGF